MKASVLIVSLLFSSVFAMAQSPEPRVIPENQWTPLTVNEVQTSVRFTNDSIVYLNYRKDAGAKVLVKIKTANGITMYRECVRKDEGLAQYDISDLPDGAYTVELSVNGDVADAYKLVKN